MRIHHRKRPLLGFVAYSLHLLTSVLVASLLSRTLSEPSKAAVSYYIDLESLLSNRLGL